jgi:hypothetical protein
MAASMFLSAWSLSLLLCSIIVLFLVAGAARTGVRVLRYWNPASDSNLQISLENETWLASTLIEFALAVQGLSLVLFILAADSYSQVIAGAMCATGSLLANEFGLPTLSLKLAGFFLYAFWILLHQLDIRSEVYPLVRVKYVYLLLLLPFILADGILQTLYIAKLDPDIITSCCAVVFSAAPGEGGNLLGSLPRNAMLGLYYATIVVLLGLALLLRDRLPGLKPAGEKARTMLTFLYAGGWLWFFGLALAVITSVISSYIYAMPFHRCPFCIIKPEYGYIGLAIYFTLIGGTFFGTSTALAAVLGHRPGLAGPVRKYRRIAVDLSFYLLLILTILTSYHYLLYTLTGGES